MISTVRIDSEKQQLDVMLHHLTRINYFVGLNNSGKTRSLEYIHRYYDNTYFLTEEEKIQLLDVTGSAEFIDKLIEDSGASIFIVDEPEEHLHPQFQKQIPYLLEAAISGHPDIQFFLATHSPFIISTMGRITDTQREKNKGTNKTFTPTQRVYFFSEGKTSNRKGVYGYDPTKTYLFGSFGYWGIKANYIASKMLGAGFMDFIEPQESALSANAPIVVFCEGEGRDEDARLYNTIFYDMKPHVLFVSARGSSQVHRTFEVMTEIQRGLSANLNILMLRDRDHEFPLQTDIEEYEKTNPGHRVLQKRAIECYLYNSETLGLLLKSRGIELPSPYRRELNSLQRVIQYEVEQAVPGKSYKTRLKNTFKHALKDLDFWKTNPKIKDIPLTLATLIRPGTKTYRNLKKDIFS